MWDPSFWGWGMESWVEGTLWGSPVWAGPCYYLVEGSRILLFRIWIQGGLAAVVTLAFAMFAWLRVKAPQYPTMRKFHWFLAFSLLLIWFYNEAMIDRTFAPVAIFFMFWVSEGGGDTDKSEEEEATVVQEGLPDEAA